MSQAIPTDEARQRLFSIMDRDTGFTEKAEEALELGKTYLGVDNGHVTRINPELGYWEAIASSDPPDGAYPSGLILNLEKTYCRRTIQQNSSVVVHDAPNQGWEDDIAYKTHRLNCYHGTPITVDNTRYGTVCFVSEESREKPFNDDQTAFAELIGRLLEHVIEISQKEAKLDRRQQLIRVLNRVLRHNLRNDITVIRGRMERIEELAEEPDNPADLDVVISKANELINLSEKARTLESVLQSESVYQDTDIPALIDSLIDDLATKYPEATFTREGTESVTVSVLPHLETALRELIDNAAKHTRFEPAVTISVEITDEAVEIHVSDTGPGLPHQEREVLDEGIETPLTHGSGLGLWLVYWVVTSHNGTLETAVTDDGTTVTVSLPPHTADVGIDSG